MIEALVYYVVVEAYYRYLTFLAIGGFLPLVVAGLVARRLGRTG